MQPIYTKIAVKAKLHSYSYFSENMKSKNAHNIQSTIFTNIKVSIAAIISTVSNNVHRSDIVLVTIQHWSGQTSPVRSTKYSQTLLLNAVPFSLIYIEEIEFKIKYRMPFWPILYKTTDIYNLTHPM